MEKKTTIYLIRHGETDANITRTFQGQSDVPLNENGLHQAELAAARFGKMHFDKIFSSDLSRAAVTARKIAGEREIVFTPELREWHLGKWEGLSFAQAAEKFPDEMAAYRAGLPDAAVPGGESRRELHDRARRIISTLLDDCPGQTLLCVTHGGLLRAIFKNITGITCPAQMIRTDNTCFCGFSFSHDSQQWQMLCWNDTAHLEKKALDGSW